MRKLRITNGLPYPLGASLRADGSINFSMVNDTDEECGIILYRKGIEQKERILFDKGHRVGNIFCALIEGIDPSCREYNFFIGDKVLVDRYAKRIVGNEKWRGGEFKRPFLRGSFYDADFDWQQTARTSIPYSESIMYCLNVRGYTRHGSSKVKNKGTFDGIIEKIPYLKELGINAIELMPAYEFEECEWEDAAMTRTMEYQVENIGAEINDKEPEKAKRLNCWGYKEAFYFAPKASYAAGDDASLEFKRMVRELHKNGIEVIMQFYFPHSINQGYIVEVLKHWVFEYHVDGFHLKGDRMPVTLIATEPLFAQTKIMYDDFKLDEIYRSSKQPGCKTLAYYRDDFMNDIRRYLKGDSGMLKAFQYHMSNSGNACGIVNYVTNYYGFTLADLVSYDAKHNEENGENNMDGTDRNYSWNCGAEGPSRKKTINRLRHVQMKNILSFLFMAQGTPLIMAGDEFGNSQNGNNNCYCQDNETGWVDWRGLAKNADIYEYIKALIAFRREHPILHLDDKMSMLDRFGCGYPDLSYHGDEAWHVRIDDGTRHIGIMYCGQDAAGEKADYIYIASNMHWDSHSFALPSIANYEWVKAFETAQSELSFDHEKNSAYIEAASRSVTVLVGKKFLRPPKKSAKAAVKDAAEKEKEVKGSNGDSGLLCNKQ